MPNMLAVAATMARMASLLAARAEAVIDRFQLPPALVHLVLVNGSYVAADQRAARVLADGDALAIWPPIAGG